MIISSSTFSLLPKAKLHLPALGAELTALGAELTVLAQEQRFP